MERILVATDGSEGANRAIDFAAQLAGGSGAHLLIVTVAGIHTLPDAVLRHFTRTQNAWVEEALTSISATVLKEARERAQAAGATDIRLQTGDGDVAQAILDIASQSEADVIVVGKRGSGRVTGLLLGSVSQKLVSIASKVVVVVP